MRKEPRLTVRDLEKRFGTDFTVSDVSFDIAADEIVALLGPSGCGKTTTLRCVAGVETPDAGEIRIDGEVVHSETVSVPPEGRGIGMVYQNYAIWPHKTVYENVVFPLKYGDHSFEKSEYDARVREVLELVEIADLAEMPANELSGGQQQRTALARALVHDPGLLLLDEPLSNLDSGLRATMRFELQRIQHELGVSMLYVTHDQQEAFYLADRVIVMKDGRLIERGTPSKLYAKPETPFTRSFVGSWNQIPGVIDTLADGSRVLRTPLDDCPLSTVDVVSNGADGSVCCFVRPTDIELKPAETGAIAAIQRRGRVIAEGLLGELYEVTVRLDEDDVELVVQTEQYHDFARGDDVVVHIEPQAIKIYDD